MEYDCSIIIVNWNTCALLEQCLNSIFSSCGEFAIQIIVVDNASSDGSQEMVLKTFPKIRLMRMKSNLGFAAANNIGIQASQGKFVFLVNSDIIILPKCIERLLKFMENNPDVGMAGPRILNPDGSLQPSTRTFPSLRTSLFRALALDRLFQSSSFFSADFMKYWDHKTIRNVDILSGCFWILRREALDTVGLLDEDFYFYSEDVDWCKRFHENRWKVVFYPEAEAIHTGGGSSSKDPLRCYKNMLDAQCHYWLKHHGRFKTALWTTIRSFHYFIRFLYSSLSWTFSSFKDGESLYKVKRSYLALRWTILSCFGQKTVTWR